MRYIFEDYTFDTVRRELHRRSDVVAVAPQVFDLLEYLIRNRERVVSKDDLIRVIWNGRAVSDAALTTRLNAARNAIGDTGERQHLIKTLPRKGFRFVGIIFEEEQRAAELTSLATHGGDLAKKSPSVPRLSIVVLPFANLSGDPQQDYFVDGVTESLTTDLSRIRGSFVIGRHTAFTYKGIAVDLKQIGRELNVRYVLEGSVQHGGDRFRVNVQLVDAETGAHLWADRFDKPIADLFDVQDEIVSRLANELEAQLTEVEARRSERSPHPSSMELYFQGRALVNKGWTPEYLAPARRNFERALTLDPKNIEALVGMTIIDAIIGTHDSSDDRAVLLARAEATLIKVLSIVPGHAFAHLVLGGVLNVTNRAAQGIAACERALALDRNLAEAHAQIGFARYFMGHGAETEVHVNKALQLSPRDVSAHRWLFYVGLAKLLLKDDAEALCWFRRSIEAHRNYPIAHFVLAATLALLGSLDEATIAAKDGAALDPNFTIRRFRKFAQSDNPIFLAQRGRIYEGMRLARVTEG
ncbi:MULTISPECIES: winged helix-turn-helix domain-containing tetratricopeptide repeat protein [unclassified Bradyrhizobium]